MKYFSQKVKIPKPGKSKFDLTHERKFSFNMGELIPIIKQDVMPGDSYRMSTENMIRLAPMLAPMMHRVDVYIHYFFVPHRLVWDEWETFITQGNDGVTPPVFPTLEAGLVTGTGTPNPVPARTWWDFGTLADYMGIPVWDNAGASDATGKTKISALPFRAYQLIWNEYYRDQDLQTPWPGYTDGGAQAAGRYQVHLTLQQRCWEKDYFTSARPWAQKGGAVSIPFTYKEVSDIMNNAGGTLGLGHVLGKSIVGGGGVDNTELESVNYSDGHKNSFARIENIDTLATINEFREANAYQRFLEKLSRAGNRYIEYIKAVFGELSSDSRLQRPEYLGGGKNPIVISEVLSTMDLTADGLPQGTMAGHGIGAGNTPGFTRSFNEHGTILGLMSVLPRTGYQQGIERDFTRFDQLDFPIPDFAHLGEQEIKNKEIYFNYGETTPNEATFGYQERYSECKFKNSSSHGDFRKTLAFWHMDRIFSSRPSLNATFVKSDPTTRVFAIDETGDDHLWCQVINRVSAVRPLPYQVTAGIK